MPWRTTRREEKRRGIGEEVECSRAELNYQCLSLSFQCGMRLHFTEKAARRIALWRLKSNSLCDRQLTIDGKDSRVELLQLLLLFLQEYCRRDISNLPAMATLHVHRHAKCVSHASLSHPMPEP